MRSTKLKIASILLFALALSACSTASQVQSQNSGNAGKQVEQAAAQLKPSDLKIAFFSSATNNSYLQAGIAGVKKAAQEVGASIDVFDGKFDPQVQYNQIQSALTSGKYNAFEVEANDGNLLCNILTKQAAGKGILISVINQPLCGRATKAGDALWQPGTVTFIGGQTLDVYRAWIKQIMADNPGGGNVAVLSGPALSANTINLDEALKEMKANPKFKIVARQKTDYSTPQGYQAAQTILQANKNLNIIVSNYSDMTHGVVEAVKAANRQGVKVYDMGGNKWAVNAVKSGELAQTVMFLPEREGYMGVKAIADFVSGKQVPHFINLTKSETLPGTAFVTKRNVDKFTPEY